MSASVFEFAKTTLSKALGKEGQPNSFTIGERIAYDSVASIWSIHKGVKKDDQSPLMVFVFQTFQKNADTISVAKNCLKRMKTIKHPSIIKLIDIFETESVLAYATEEVIPLSESLKRDSTENTIAYGLFKVAAVLDFIENKARLIHGQIRMDSIFVNGSGEWKLGGFDILSDSNNLSWMAQCYSKLDRIQPYIPPELSGNILAIRDETMLTIDRWCLGVLLWEVFNKTSLRYFDQLSDTSKIPNGLMTSFKQLTARDRNKRIEIHSFFQKEAKSYFNHPMIHLSDFLENIAIKDAQEKENFMEELDSRIETLPLSFLKLKVLPELMNAVEYGGAGTKGLVPILKIGSKLDGHEFESKVSPLVVKLFASTDRAMRVALCEHLGQLIEHLSLKTVNESIFVNLASGFNDTNAIVRERTLMAMVTILPKLNEKLINNDLLRYLARLQTDEQPGIRTNTTICLGKMYKYLTEPTKKRVLIPSFTRSLQDPFPPARAAGLMAIGATVEAYDLNEIARHLLPIICPLCTDPEIQVRKQAVGAIEALFKKMKAAVNDLNDQQVNQTSSETRLSGSLDNTNESQQDTMASWTGWGTSIASKLVSSTAAVAGLNSSRPRSAEDVSNILLSAPVSNNQNIHQSHAKSNPSVSHTPYSLSSNTRTVQPSVQNTTNKVANVIKASGWDDFDADDDDEWVSPSTTVKSNNSKFPAKPAATAHTKNTSDVWGDFGSNDSEWGSSESKIQTGKSIKEQTLTAVASNPTKDNKNQTPVVLPGSAPGWDNSFTEWD